MIDGSLLAYYDVVVGLVTGTGVFYFLFFRPTVVDYHHFLVLTVSGLLLFLVGGPIAELLYAPLVHWIHGVAGLLVVLGLYDPLENDLRREAWADVLLEEPTQIRKRANWMAPVDDAILQLFQSTELVLTPAIIGHNIDYSREEVNRRLGELEARGYVTKVERGKYRITDLGRQYVAGPVSPSTFTQLWPGRTSESNTQN